MRDPDQFLDQSSPILLCKNAQFSSHPKSKKEKNDQLGDKSFGRGHTDLRASMSIDDMVRIPCQRRFHHIADGKGHCPLFLPFPQCREGISRLTGLGNGYEQGILSKDGVSIPELGTNISLYRNPAEPLDEEFPHQGRMIGGATSNETDPPNLFKN